jgi:hypothetical protein
LKPERWDAPLVQENNCREKNNLKLGDNDDDGDVNTRDRRKYEQQRQISGRA